MLYNFKLEVNTMVSDRFKRDVDIATDFILSVDAPAKDFDRVLLKKLKKSDLTDAQKDIVRNSMSF